MCNSIRWDYPQLFPFTGTFVKPFPYRIVQMCLLSEMRGCQGDTAWSTCSNDSVVIFAWFLMTFALPPPTPPSCLETCCNAVDLLTVSVSPPPETSSKNSWSLNGPGVLATWRWVDFLSDPDGSFPYFIPFVGSRLSAGLKVHMVPISRLLKFMEGSFGLFPHSAGWTIACGRVYLLHVWLNL